MYMYIIYMYHHIYKKYKHTIFFWTYNGNRPLIQEHLHEKFDKWNTKATRNAMYLNPKLKRLYLKQWFLS